MAEQTQTQITAYGRPKSSREGGSTTINYNISGGYTSGNINANSATINRIKSELIDTNVLNAGTGNFVYLVASDGTISTLRGDTLNYGTGIIDDLTASKIKTDTIDAETANLKTIFNDYFQGKEMVVDYLTVNKAAHFFEVIIDKMKSVGGTIINTACNSQVDYVKAFNSNDEEVPLNSNNISYFRCYFKRVDDDGSFINNDWEIYDQAICRNCNLVAGVNQNAGNHYYWRLVIGKNTDPVFVNFNTGEIDDTSVNQPDYSVVFVEESDITFTYSQTIDENNNQVNEVTDFNTTADIPADKTTVPDGIKLKIEDTIHGLNVVPVDIVVGTKNELDPNSSSGLITTNIMQKPVMMGGGDATFSFKTLSPTRLNVVFVFDDGTIEFHPAQSIIDAYNTAYSTNLNYITNYDVKVVIEKNIEFISITSDEVNVWNSCHYIDLGNVNPGGTYDPQSSYNQVDQPTYISPSTFDMAPQIGDQLVQLGYRFNLLDSYAQAVNKQAWIDAHPDEVARSSAIIIAAYKTPDTGFDDTPVGEERTSQTYLPPIQPPSYAQYQYITNFDLGRHRGSYFDASGAYFKGNLVSTSGQVIPIDDGGFDINVDVYKIIPAANVITVDANNLVTPNPLGVKFMVTSNSITNPLVPVGCCFGYKISNGSETLVNESNAVSINLTGVTTSDTIYMNLYKGNVSAATHTLLDTLEMKPVELDAASGQPGANGDFTDYIYKLGAGTTGPTVPASLAIKFDQYTIAQKDGWTKEMPSINRLNNTDQDDYVWMAQRSNTWNGSIIVPGAWSKTRLTGQNGEPGTDGTDFEFIYIVNTGNTPTNPNNITYGEVSPYGIADGTDTNKDQDDWVPNTWADNPQGITSTEKYEWMSQRASYIQNGQKHWGSFTPPVIWSRWGEKGQDGDGYEYIYYVNNDSTTPPTINYSRTTDYKNANILDDDFCPYISSTGKLHWFDDPQEVSENNKYEWVATRKKVNGSWQIIDGVQGGFSDPVIWGSYSIGTPGPQGENGGHYVLMYKNATVEHAPSKPNNGTTHIQMINAGWSDVPSSPNLSNNEYTWMTQTFVKIIASGNTYIDDYTDCVWTTPIKITGDNGKNGEDGKYTEFIYRRFKEPPTWTNNNLNPSYWAANDSPDYLGEAYYTTNSDSPNNKWTDNPQGVNETYQYEYVATREYDGEHFTKFNVKDNQAYDPAIWSKWGEKGQDGDGYEYIYYVNNSTTPPTISYSRTTDYKNTDILDDDFCPYIASTGSAHWFDDPQEVSENNKYEWVATRKKVDGSWRVVGGVQGGFSDPVIWGSYSIGAPGANGGRYILLYQNYNPNGTLPSIVPDGVSEYSVNDLISAGWAREASDPDFTNGEYTYMTQAFFNDGQLQSRWSEPVRITGADGEPGADGTDIEFIYYKTSDNPLPNNIIPTNITYGEISPNGIASGSISNRDQDDWVPNGWSDNPVGVDDSDIYEWMSQRTSYTQNDQKHWNAFTTPVVWSNWGVKGQDGDGVEYIFARNDSETTAPTLTQYYYADYSGVYGAVTVDTNRPNTYNNAYLITRWSSYSGATGYEQLKSDYLPISNRYENGSSPTGQSSQNISTNWTDEPQGISSATGCSVEWVSQRKYNGVQGAWQPFSEPKVWTRYSRDGATGPTGPTGATGAAAQEWELIPLSEQFEVNIAQTLDNSLVYKDVKGVLTTDLKYALAHNVGNEKTFMTGVSGLSGVTMTVRDDANTAGITGISQKHSWNSNNDSSDFTITTETVMGVANVTTIQFKSTNLLEKMYTPAQTGDLSTTYQNYYWLHKNTSKTKYQPTKLTVNFTKSGDSTLKQNENINLIFKPDHIFTDTDYAFNSIYQGLAGVTGAYPENGFSQIHQTWNNINLAVANIEDFTGGSIPSDTDLMQYAYYRTNSFSTPTGPSGDVTTTSGNNVWTNTYQAPTNDYPYVYITSRDRTSSYGTTGLVYSSWSSWVTPFLFAKYGSNTRVINSSQLDIKADEILLEVSTGLETTGIDIQKGTITIDAENTTIGKTGADTGSLKVYSGNGIVFYDNNDLPKINIHASNLQNSSDNSYTYPLDYTYNSLDDNNTISIPYSSSSAQLTGTITKSWLLKTAFSTLGYLTSGSIITVTIKNPTVLYSGGNGLYYPNSGNKVKCYFELLAGSTSVASTSSNPAYVTNITSGFTLYSAGSATTLTYTVPSYYANNTAFYLRAKLDANYAYFNGNIQGNTKLYAIWDEKVTINVVGSTTAGLLEIANNGINFTVSDDSKMLFKDDNFNLTTKYSGIKVIANSSSTNFDTRLRESLPLQRYISGNTTSNIAASDYYGGLGTQLRVSETSTLDQYADIYVMPSTSFYLSSTYSFKGRVIYVISQNGNGTISCGTGTQLLWNDSLGTSRSGIYGCNMLICYGHDGTNWRWALCNGKWN